MGLETKLTEIAKQRLTEMEDRQSAAVGRWKDIIDIVESHYKEKGRSFPLYQKYNIARCCDNLFDHYLSKRGGVMNEETQSSAISYVAQMLPTIPALLPSLASDNIAIHQAIDLPEANIYYMNIKADVTKGSVTVGDSLINARTGHASGEASRLYASDKIVGEVMAAPSQARTATFSAVAMIPAIAGSFVFTLNTTVSGVTSTETFTDAGDGTAVGSKGSTATNVASTGVIAVDTGSGNTVNAVAGAVSYRVNIESNTDAIGGLRFEVTSASVTAETFPLRVDYTAFAQVLMQRAHGIVLNKAAMDFAVQEIRFAIDERVFGQALTDAQHADGATSPGTFDCTVGTGQEWIFRMNEFKRYLSKGSANIFAKTLRCRANVITGGINVCALIENLPGFTPASGIGTKPPAGPHVFGKLGGMMVICNPFYDADTYLLSFRGDNWLYAGLAYCPYLPLYQTNPVELATFDTQQGFLSMAGIASINKGMFTYGYISNF